jgi:cytochrome P450
LATNTKCQEWLGEEIDAVFGLKDNFEDRDYEQVFPKLVRCLAVMVGLLNIGSNVDIFADRESPVQHETLRIYGPVFFIPKYTNESPQQLEIQGKMHIIPPKTYVYIDSAALHTTPDYWGSDSLEWKPERWITVENGREVLFEPRAGSFVPWASGPRVCPGKKFSQVEFAAVISCLFKKHRVRPVLEAGETSTHASQRILRVVEDSGLEVTLKMKHPELIKLKWEQRA